jgi:aminoglycoside phosphotransferase
MSCLFPPAKQAAIDRAMMTAFGTAELDGAQPISGGLSGAGLWRIRVGGIAYVLKIDGARVAINDPVRSYACMRTAAAAFLAPRLRYADAEDGVAIMDHVTSKSLALDYPGAGHELLVELAQAVRILHETPAFPPLIDYLEGIASLIGQHQALDILDPAATQDLFALFGQLRAGYRTLPGDLVSSHNDLNPGNIVYDGTRLWLVDWDAAFLADRYVDLATVAGWFTRDAGGEAALLTTYFGGPPIVDQQARFYLMRQVNHLFCGLIFLNVASAERPGVRLADRTLAGPDLTTLHQRLGSGEFAILEWENRVVYGKARLAAALDGLRAPAFGAALAQLAG